MPERVTTVQGNEAVLNVQKSAEAIVGWHQPKGRINRSPDLTGKGGNAL
ncbi:MAG: hypothetical protein LUE27_04560 [Clostridia bacterium]|nr:hypothetical protein [Clostridia bacterium]